MMKKRFIQVRNTSVFILIGIMASSCFVARKIPLDQDAIVSIINDYNFDFSRFSKMGELKSLLIYIDSKKNPGDNIIIQDYPLEYLYQDIIKKIGTVDSVIIGVYESTPIEFIFSDISVNKFEGFIKYDSVLIKQAHKTAKVFDEDGNQLDVDIIGDLMQYEPVLVTTYDIYTKKKKMELFDGRILTETFFYK